MFITIYCGNVLEDGCFFFCSKEKHKYYRDRQRNVYASNISILGQVLVYFNVVFFALIGKSKKSNELEY